MLLNNCLLRRKGLPDDCYELTTMRKYRDEILKQTNTGREIISFYYAEAPRIVKQINNSIKKKEICDWIYSEICEVIKLYENGQVNEAGNRYLLRDRFKFYVN